MSYGRDDLDLDASIPRRLPSLSGWRTWHRRARAKGRAAAGGGGREDHLAGAESSEDQCTEERSQPCRVSLRPPLALSPEEEIRERPGVRMTPLRGQLLRSSAALRAEVCCPSCRGLRTVAHRNRDSVALCPDCRRGEVIPRETFHEWLERFSAEKCAVMARAIWGAG